MNIEKIKAHIKEHKEKYITVGVTAVISAGITYIIMRGRYATLHGGVEPILHGGIGGGSDTVAIRPLSFFSHQINNIVTVVERDGRGHPGYRIRRLEDLREWDTQGLTAIDINTSPSRLSSHLTKGIPESIDNFHYERVPV